MTKRNPMRDEPTLVPDGRTAREKKAKKAKFNPNRDFVAAAMEEYLANGGKITRMEDFFDKPLAIETLRDDPTDYEDFIVGKEGGL